MRHSCVLAQDLVVSEKCSVKLTDQNFKSVIESNGMHIFAVNTRLCVCLLLLGYVPCLQTFRPDLGGNFVRVRREEGGFRPSRRKRKPGDYQRLPGQPYPYSRSVPQGIARTSLPLRTCLLPSSSTVVSTRNPSFSSSRYSPPPPLIPATIRRSQPRFSRCPLHRRFRSASRFFFSLSSLLVLLLARHRRQPPRSLAERLLPDRRFHGFPVL